MQSLRKVSRKSEEQKEMLANIKKIYNSKEDATKLFDDYTTIPSEIGIEQFREKNSKY